MSCPRRILCEVCSMYLTHFCVVPMCTLCGVCMLVRDTHTLYVSITHQCVHVTRGVCDCHMEMSGMCVVGFTWDFVWMWRNCFYGALVANFYLQQLYL